MFLLYQHSIYYQILLGSIFFISFIIFTDSNHIKHIQAFFARKIQPVYYLFYF